MSAADGERWNGHQPVAAQGGGGEPPYRFSSPSCSQYDVTNNQGGQALTVRVRGQGHQIRRVFQARWLV